MLFPEIGHVTKFQEQVLKIIQGSTTQLLEPPARLRPPADRISRALGIMDISISNISRIVDNGETEISNISRIIENVGDFNFQYFQARTA